MPVSTQVSSGYSPTAGGGQMEQRWFEIGALVKVKSETECNGQLRGDSLPDGVCGRAGTILPVRSLQGVQISGDRFLPLVFI